MSEIKKFIAKIKSDELVSPKFDYEQMEYLEKIADESHPILDKKVFMSVVMIVGTVLLLSIILASLIIFIKDQPVDEFFIMIASTCIGALAGLLVPTPMNN
ncbi:hypothetical protein [Flexithrix dorotheae]|uniref:hypothetical protein n=1 Tax=Flexithrix dorotheae TaxID=70993 RepID=UPI000381131A|nr:hypothetical protein [Flexithrix dorotheae]